MSDYFVRDVEALDYSKTMVQRMDKLSKPLFDHTMITNFSYLKFNEDGTVLNLTTEEKWIQFRFDQKIKYKILFKDHLDDAKHNIPYTFLWPKNTEDHLLAALHQYNIWNGCNIYIANTHCIEVFSFASSRENEGIQNFYINNLDLLRAFIICFKEQVNQLPGINSKRNLVSTDLILPFKPIISNNQNSSAIDCIYQKTKIKHIHVTNNFYLTKKELECCSHLMRGKSIKAIAKITNLSPRTIESHINNAKQKANCSTKIELIDIIASNRWIFDALIQRN